MEVASLPVIAVVGCDLRVVEGSILSHDKVGAILVRSGE